MTKVPHSKQALTQLRRQRDLYVRMLPSLDLKRRKLTAEVNQARQRLADGEDQLEALLDHTARALPMLGNPALDLLGLVEVHSIDCAEENMVGVRLPVLERADIRTRPYSLLGKPHWVDPLAEAEAEIALHQIQLAIERKRLGLLEHALRRVSQRVNLFEKVLIPEAERTIQRIQIHLADAERAAVVRSKIFKSKLEARQRQAAS